VQTGVLFWEIMNYKEQFNLENYAGEWSVEKL
jgi:hypothetical protein